MGQAARKVEPARERRVSHIRVARAPKAHASTRNARAQELAARRNFRMFATLMTVVAVLGVSRVWLSVEATRASRDADLLRDSIRAERYEGDMLEVRESALGSPSRIRAIAGKAMDMAPAASVSYLRIADASSERPAQPVRPHQASADAGLKRVLSNVLDLTAGEAQVLLVGDVGLASTR